jgi:type VI secretion system secreted protein VgrG
MANVMPRVMEIVTPLGDGVLLFHTMSAREEMSRLFEYHLDLLSAKPDINLDEILGKNVTIKLGLPDDETRHFNGFVTRFAQGGMHGRYHRYVATVRPWLWFLTRTSDCRIFQEMTVPDIIKAVFADHPSAELKLELTSNYRKWTYCVQYRETDFNFVSRLMEQEGIAYYFRHTEGHNTLVLTDSTSKHTPAAGCKALSYIDPHDVVREDHEHVSSWDYSREIQPGVYVHDDYDLERPSVELKASKTLPRKYKPSDYEVYDWPGEYVEKPHGEQYAAVRIDELGSQFEIARATTNSRALTVGSLLNLEDHPRPDQNREYLVLGAAYEMTFGDYEALPEQTGSSYKCSFLAMPSGQQFRPQRQTPKPFVQGPQTAVVVGPAGEEIYTDKYGRVKVQFHWDRRGKKDDKSSCWIRVSHPWAGKNWGGISNPRIGQEVIVDFLEGDPDQPIITGRVYNAEQMPPYDLPANQTQSGMKSRSSKGGGPANFNEIRMEDKMGSEQLFIHAEKNQDIEVENDETHWVGRDRTKTIDHDEMVHVKHDRKEVVDHDELIVIHHDRTETVDNNETLIVKGNRRENIVLDHQEKIDGNMDVSIAKNLTESVVMNYSENVGIAMELTVGGLLAMTVGAAMSEVVGLQKTETIGRAKSEMIGTDKSIDIKKNLTENVGKDQTTTIKENLKETIGGQHQEKVTKEYSLQAKKIQLVAYDEIALKTGSAEIIMKKNGDITIKGGKVNIKASGDMILKGSTIKEN